MARDSGEVTALCRAKLNLVLEILGRRADGYHELATIMHPIALADRVRVRRSGPGLAFVQRGLPTPEGEDNLVYRAARRFYEAARLDPAVEVTLEKTIPPGSGLGGGSADAAGVLLALARLHGRAASDPELPVLARELGADVPYSLGEGPALAEGVGERLTPLRPAQGWVVVAVGASPVGTRWAYEQVRPEQYSEGTMARRAALSLVRRGRVDRCFNVFAEALAGARPDLAELIAATSEVSGGKAGLTGSGSGVFAPAASKEAARTAAEALGRRGYWVWWGRLADGPVIVEGGPETGDAGGSAE